MSYKRGIAVCTFNRGEQIKTVLDNIRANSPEDARIVVCDDGSTDNTVAIVREHFPTITVITGENLGVGANKNRALYLLRDCDFICILEDDLMPVSPGWFEEYQEFCLATNIHHLCRVQDKQIPESVKDFGDWVTDNLNVTPIYGKSPRGDMTFITNLVIRRVGGIHPDFRGVGHAHGQWSDRVDAAGLIGHPNKWIDLAEVSCKFAQLGDTAGGRWNFDPAEVKAQIAKNAELRKTLGTEPLYVGLFLP